MFIDVLLFDSSSCSYVEQWVIIIIMMMTLLFKMYYFIKRYVGKKKKKKTYLVIESASEHAPSEGLDSDHGLPGSQVGPAFSHHARLLLTDDGSPSETQVLGVPETRANRDPIMALTEQQQICFELITSYQTAPSPACKETPAVLLHQDSGLPDPLVLDPLQPSSHRLLDLDAGSAELVGTKLLQICHLTCAEEDLGLPKLELVRVLVEMQRHRSRQRVLY